MKMMPSPVAVRRYSPVSSANGPSAPPPPSSSSGMEAAVGAPPPVPHAAFHHGVESSCHYASTEQRRRGTTTTTANDPHSVTPTPGGYSPHPGLGGLGHDLAMEGTPVGGSRGGGATPMTMRSTRNSRLLTSSSSSSEASMSGGGAAVAAGSFVSPIPRRGAAIGAVVGGTGIGGGASANGIVRRKKRVVRRRMVKTPATALINGASAGTVARKTPPCWTDSREDHDGGGNDAAAITLSNGVKPSSGSSKRLRRINDGATSASVGAATAPPSIPSPESDGGGGPSYAERLTSSEFSGLLRPRPSAPAPPPAYHPALALTSPIVAAAAPPPSIIFPDPSDTVNRPTLSGDDPLYWSYDVGAGADPRSFNSAPPPLLAPRQPPPPEPLPTVHYPRGYGMLRAGYHEPPQPPIPVAPPEPWSKAAFEFGGQLGKGKFGIVYRAIEKDTDRPVALKFLNKARVLKCSVAPKLLRREVEIQARLKHDNIVSLLGYYHDDTKVCLLLQHAPDGDLYQLMSKRKEDKIAPSGALPHAVAASFTAQVASALTYLSTHHVAHRDIKPENLLLCGTVDGEATPLTQVKLADFGWAVHAPPPMHHRRSTLCGTPEYVPPEMIRNAAPKSPKKKGKSPLRRGGGGSTSSPSSPSSRRNYDASYVDAWALGVLVCEMIRGRSPFFLSQSAQKSVASEKGYSNAHEAVFDLIRDFRPEAGVVPADANDRDFVQLARALLQDRPESRMHVGDVAFHPWVTRIRDVSKKKRSDDTAHPIKTNFKRVKAAA